MGERRFFSAALQILALWTIAVVQPLLELLSRSPEFFVAHRAGPEDIWLMVGALTLVLPLPLVAAGCLASFAGARVRAAVLATIVALLTAVIAMQAAQRLGIDTWRPAALVALACGIGAAVVYLRIPLVGTFLTVLSIAVLAVPIVFATTPGITRLVVPRSDVAEARANPAGTARPVPIVMVVFDELPLLSLLDADRRIDVELYPHFAALARDGIWFRNATTLSDYTRWALPPIVTGLYPWPEAVPTPADHPHTLFTFLGPSHRLEIVEAVTDLCPPELCRRPVDPRRTRLRRMGSDLRILFLHVLLTGDLRERLPDVRGSWAGFSGADTNQGEEDGVAADWQARWHQADGRNPAEIAERPDVVRRFIDSISADDPQPTFYFLHSLLSHHPYLYLPGGQRNVTHARIPGPMPSDGTDDEWANAQSQQRQLLQTGFVDGLVGRLVARLKAEGLYDRALVIVTSDHGAAFHPGRPLRKFSDETAAEIMRIPLIIKFPAGSAADRLYPPDPIGGSRVSDRNVETVDIAPTVARALGTGLPWRVDGSSLLDPSTPGRPRKRFNVDDTVRWYAGDGPPVHGALKRKLTLFGDSSNRFRIPRPARFADLIGRPVEEVRVVPGDAGVVDVSQAWRYSDFDSTGSHVPFDVSGRLRGAAAGSAPVAVAVAINGVIRSVTRTWEARPDTWMATPPLDAWQQGRNQLDVFMIEDAPGGPVLRHLRRPTVRLSDLNLISGIAERAWGVKQSGFHANEGTEEAPFRWTRGHGSVVVPLSEGRPRTLRLQIARGSRPDMPLKVMANDCVLFEGALNVRDWEKVLPLEACKLQDDQLTLTLISDTARGPGRDRRRLGVAVRGMVLE